MNLGCEQHATHDCGCPGYPNLQTALRDCGNHCHNLPYIDRCIRCQAARLIDTLQNRNGRYLERIIELQDTIDELSPPHGHITIHLPTATIEQIVETDRIFPALEELRTAINNTWENQ
jgi:hypothetical protein